MTTRDYFTLLKKAEKGDHEAQFHVGHHYYRLQEGDDYKTHLKP